MASRTAGVTAGMRWARRRPLAAGLAILLSLLIAVAAAAEEAPAGRARARRAKKKPARPAVEFGGSFGFEVIYDDNIIHYSDEDLTEFSTLPNLGKFSIATAGDWILRPRFELSMTTRSLTGKPLGARFRYTHWSYVENDVKNNESYQLRLTHPGYWRDSFELTAYHSPLSYIRNFRDRAPYTPRNQPLAYTSFSYASNSLSLGYSRRWTNALDTTFDLGRSIRYYSQEFMENDTWEWRVGGEVRYRLWRRYRLRGEYLYSYARARGADEVGERLETSDNGDPSYERDSYRVALEYRPRRNRYRVNDVTLGAQHQIYYFTSEKPLHLDPTHVGRKDKLVRLDIEASSRPIIGPVTAYAGYRFTRRTSESPSAGAVGADIGEEKNYTDNRTWIGATYPF